MRQVRERSRAGAGWFWAVLPLLLIWGCSGSSLPDGVQVSPEYSEVSPDPYRIEVGDELDIEFFYQAEMSRKVVVRTDGRITLSGVGELEARGRTPGELAQAITQSYSTLFKDPLVTVNVAHMAAARVYVVGEVARPGGYQLGGQLTLATALSEAGGPTRYASLGEIQVIRRNGPATPVSFKVDGESVRRGEWTGPEVVLIPNDIVVVPRSAMGRFADIMNVLFSPGLLVFMNLWILIMLRTEW